MGKADWQKRPVVTAPTRIMVVVGMTERRTEIVRWLDEKADLAVVVAHRDPAAAIADIARTLPDMIVIDPETAAEGFAEFATLAVRRPELPVLMVRADGSPGVPVERFGQWHEKAAQSPLRLTDVAAELVAAIRAIATEPLAEIGCLVRGSRPADADFVH